MSTKVLHIIDCLSYSGVATFTVRLIKALPQYDHTIISCFNGNAEEEFKSLSLVFKILIKKTDVKYRYLFIKYWKLVSFLFKNRFDVIHYHQGGVGLILLALIFGKKAKVIHHFHSSNLIGDHSRSGISLAHKIMLKFLSMKTVKVAVAQHILAKYQESITKDATSFLIKNSVPYNFNKKEKYSNTVGFIGRLNRKKGINNFIYVADHFNNMNRNIQFIAQGVIEEPITLSPNILYNHPAFSIKNFFYKTDLLYFLSLSQEGLPLVILEAISFDVGVIAFRLPGVVEVLGEDYPLYVNELSESIEKIEAFYSESFDRERLSEIHRTRINGFDFNLMIDKVNALYNLSKCK